MAHLSWLLNKSSEAEKKELEKDLFYYILHFQHILRSENTFHFLKFIEEGDSIIRFFDNGSYCENINIDGETRSLFLYRGESADILGHKNYGILNTRFKIAFEGKSIYYFSYGDKYCFLKDKDIIEFIQKIEAYNPEALIYPGQSIFQEYFTKAFSELLEIGKTIEKSDLKGYFKELQNAYYKKKDFFKDNIWKIINSFSNNLSDKEYYYNEIINRRFH